MKRSTTTQAAAALTLAAAFLLSACGGGGGSSPTPNMTPTPTPTSTATSNPLAYTCPLTGTAGAGSVARDSGAGAEGVARRMSRSPFNVASNSPTTRLVVSYSRSAFTSNLPQIAAREIALGASVVGTNDYASQNTTQRIVSVPTSALARVQSALRAQAGVQSVGITGERRYKLNSTAPYWPSDPYFTGFPITAGNTVNTYEVAPYAETSAVPGQWDMHAIGLEKAFGYVNGGNGVMPTANALGSTSIKIAIIDTGVDANHPDLQAKIHYEKCFITNLSNSQNSGNYSTDYLGHGTDVAGIAAGYNGNALGFSGVGGLAKIYAYRVFPTPDDNCANEGTSDPQCSADTNDIVSAINDAVAQGVNIISMSLGGGSCSGGVDSDHAEGMAITNALNAGIIVVAAAGNNAVQSPGTIDAPACVSGVIAVGASALDDGQTTGTASYTRNVAGATSANILEYVPSYSQYGSPNTLHSSSSWGIVAPGGDPSSADVSNSTTDDLHWIEHIWTTTPYQANSNDHNFTGNCNSDYPVDSATMGTADCRTLIAGTSMATPHVAGAAALILAVNYAAYHTPAAMKTLLCQTADDLGGDTHQGCGRLNIYRAMAVALGDTSPP